MNEPISNSTPDSQNALLQYHNQLLEPDELAELDALLQVQEIVYINRPVTYSYLPSQHAMPTVPDAVSDIFISYASVLDIEG